MNLVIGPDNYNAKTYDFTDITQVFCADHLGGFDETFKSTLLDEITQCTNGNTISVVTEYIFPTSVINNYPNLNFKFDSAGPLHTRALSAFFGYKTHPAIKFNNFICSFNGSEHVSRKLLVSTLHKFDYFNPKFCSKNMRIDDTQLTGHIRDYTGTNSDFFDKFFSSNSTFLDSIYSFGHIRFDHANNIYNLEDRLTQSFLHIVSETLATSYVPFVTEKFLYSVVTRGLFLSYAQPGWHEHVEKYYGFKLYTKLFDYRFDTIRNPVERLIELMTMIGKFSHLSYNDMYDLYLMELDAINYNYDHYFSGRYLDCLKQHHGR